ncbi:MAG: OB-fold nucleic acid binding domain-containing protein [Anaerolineae bacterium]
MTFITLEDETGLANLVIRPDVFARYRAALCQARVLLVEGRVERERSHINVQVLGARGIG